MTHTDRDWKLALIDLDGTLYSGNSVIPGAPAFVERLRERGIRPVFFTNNSTRTPEQVSAKLRALGVKAGVDEVCTSAQAAAAHIRQHYGPVAVGMMGVSGLFEALQEAGCQPVTVHDSNFAALSEQAAAAVLGMDPNLTYSSLTNFCQLVSRLGRYVVTNTDVRLPSDGTFTPGNGALNSFVATATGIEPYVAGKPSPDFVQFALQRYGVEAPDCLMVGDNPATDIAGGRQAGVYCVLVKSSAYTLEDARGASDAQNDSVRPDEAWQSVDELFR